ncbi:translation initiation factor IF-2, partial [Myxococcota bacterium]|nr:translation initiation factor IF-2 [Myxococcota bacterium]
LLRKAGPNRRKKSIKPSRPAAPPEGRRKIKVDEFISVAELAKQMGMKAGELIKKLLTLGQMVNINSTLDVETADIVASEWGYEIESIGFKEDIALGDDEPVDEGRLVRRPPIVTIMGHVDHGKTSLLDVIRKSDIVSTESGGITQHIGAYKVKTKDGEVVFIDTPGHEAFSQMRARGASVTDIVILVVAADDGVMPQTVEAINHCRDAKVPIIVAITKIDKGNANTQMVREKLTAYNLVDEKWGGDTMMLDVSSVTKAGVDNLLEMLVLQSEILDLKADPDGPCKGVVLEGELNKARGPVTNILIISGKLSVGDFVISGSTGGKIRAMSNDRGKPVKEVGPATPVEVTGLDAVPSPGDDFRSVTDEKTARRILDRRRDDAKVRDLARKSQAKGMEAIRLAIAKGLQEQLNIVLKSDVQGTMEAIKDALVRLSTEKVKVNVVNASVGGVNETDINLAITAGAVVMGFRVRPSSKARHLGEKSGVEVRQYNVIYDMVDDVKDLMRGLLPKEKKEKFLGKIEVRAVFTIPKTGSIAGCYVLEGKVNRNCQLRLFRENVQIYEGKVSSLRRFKEDAREVMQGYECGLGFENYHDIKEGDLLEAYEMIEVQAEL